MTNITTTNSSMAVQQSTHPLTFLPAVKEEKKEIFKAVQVAFAKAMADLNHKTMPVEDLQYFVNELTDNIRKNPILNSVRANEIPIAFANGIRGKYGEYFGLNVVSGEMFIEKYLEIDRPNIAKTLPVIEAPKTEPTITRADRIKFAHAAYEKFKFNDVYNDLGNIVYDFLDSEGMIHFTAKEKFEVMNKVRQQEYQRLSSPTSRQEKKQFEAKIQQIIESNEPLIPASKRECLRLFFAKMKAAGEVMQFKPEPEEFITLDISEFTESQAKAKEGSNHG